MQTIQSLFRTKNGIARFVVTSQLLLISNIFPILTFPEVTKAMSSELNNPRWAAMWDNGLAPGQAFDALTPSPLLVKYVNEGLVPTGRALVPGCGRGYDVTFLATKERQVLGLDIAETAVSAARARLNSLSDSECEKKENAVFSTTSFFDLDPDDATKDSKENARFDFVYDYTFLCALDPTVRKDWATQMSKVINPGGELLTLIFPIRPPDDRGPPFAVTLELYRELLEPVGFECLLLEELPAELSHKGRGGDSEKYSFAKSGVGRWRKT
mmetsp:Transcript_1518/g.2514  ORF Transcript_1518/g.2514 Transcript_1518/m.2514 type:complete len:270 (+) Transcript_1518:18-827(+)